MRYIELGKRLWQANWLLALLLVLLTAVVYLPALRGGFIWDDDAYITNNELLTAPDGLFRIWFSLDSPSQYFPLVYTMFRFEHAWWGVNPTGYHVVNVLLHLTNALLLWRVLARLQVGGAWLASGIWALHPVQVESVAWISERKNVLMGFFFLLTISSWIRFIDERSKRRWFFYAVALLLYALALLSKATACTLPAALLLILWWRRQSIDRYRLMQVAPFVVLALGMGLISVWWERYHQGTHGEIFAINPLERLLVASRAIWFYLGKLFWPTNLTFIYPRWRVSAAQPLDYIPLLAIVGVSLAIFFGRRHFGRGVETAMLFFGATLGPVLGFIMLYTFRYTFVADHYQYLACIGPIALVCASATSLSGSYHGARPMALGLLACIVFTLSVLTWRQSAMYADIELLWRTTLARNPDCWMAHNNLGVALRKRGKTEEALEHYKMALRMNPSNAETCINLGNIQLEAKRPDLAIENFRTALKYQPRNTVALTNLGYAFAEKEDYDQAIACYKAAIAVKPGFSLPFSNLTKLLVSLGRYDDAAGYCRAALKLKPNDPETLNSLGNIFFEQRKFDQAVVYYREAIRARRNYVEAHYRLGCALSELGQREESIAHLREALRLKPDYAEANEKLHALDVEPSN